ncbi:hypothetical protein MGN70_008396 [Eutypa lata]|nr:hypothetical protein MGN70_008396 [Eutypa lata]
MLPLMDGGVIESVGDFEPKFKFKIINGIDFFTVDADQTHGRVDVHCTLADDEGRSARFTGEGVVKLTPEVLALVYSQPDAKTPPFGAAIETFKFQTGHPEYKALEDMKFAGSQRFTYEDGVRTGIDIRISQLLSGTGMD